MVNQRTGGQTNDFAEHVKMTDVKVPTANNFDSDGSHQEEKAKDAKTSKNKETDSPGHEAKPKTDNRTTAGKTSVGKPTPTTPKFHRENAKQEKRDRSDSLQIHKATPQ